jgi:hypothetical protein
VSPPGLPALLHRAGPLSPAAAQHCLSPVQQASLARTCNTRKVHVLIAAGVHRSSLPCKSVGQCRRVLEAGDEKLAPPTTDKETVLQATSARQQDPATHLTTDFLEPSALPSVSCKLSAVLLQAAACTLCPALAPGGVPGVGSTIVCCVLSSSTPCCCCCACCCSCCWKFFRAVNKACRSAASCTPSCRRPLSVNCSSCWPEHPCRIQASDALSSHAP